MRRKLSTWLLIASMAAVLALGWITTVLAETDGDADGFLWRRAGPPNPAGCCRPGLRRLDGISKPLPQIVLMLRRP